MKLKWSLLKKTQSCFCFFRLNTVTERFAVSYWLTLKICFLSVVLLYSKWVRYFLWLLFNSLFFWFICIIPESTPRSSYSLHTHKPCTRLYAENVFVKREDPRVCSSVTVSCYRASLPDHGVQEQALSKSALNSVPVLVS